MRRDFHEIFLRRNLCRVGELFTVSFSPRFGVIIHVLSANEFLNEIYHNKERFRENIFHGAEVSALLSEGEHSFSLLGVGNKWEKT